MHFNESFAKLQRNRMIQRGKTKFNDFDDATLTIRFTIRVP